MKLVRKLLSETERKRHFLVLPKEVKTLHRDGHLTIQFGDSETTTKLDAYNRLRLNESVFKSLGLDEPGSILILEEVKVGTYRISRAQ